MRALIGIEGCAKHAERYRAQQETWARDLPDCVYFTGEMLGVPDDYESLPLKTRAMVEWALLQGYEYMFKCDTDTYVHPGRLLAADYREHDYSGYVLDTLAIPYCSGPHYWLSRKAMEILTVADWNDHAVPGYSSCEDVMVGAVLRGYGILPHHDRRYAPFEAVLPGNDVISQHLSSREPFRLQQMHEAHRAAYGG